MKQSRLALACVGLVFLNLVSGTATAQGEDWQSEALSEHVQSQLNELAHWMESEAIGEASVFPDQLFVPQSTQVGTMLLPPEEKLSQRWVGKGIRVRSLPAKLPAQSEKVTLQMAVRSVVEPILNTSAAEVHAKFKIIGVEAAKDERSADTRQLFELAGERKLPGDRLQQNAEWRIRWRLSDDGSPLIASIALETYEETTYQTADARPLLADATPQVLPEGDMQRQISRSAPDWLRSHSAEIALTQNFYQGIAVGDADGDGWDDVYLSQGAGLPNRLLLHQPDGTVRDASAEAGIDLLDRTRSALFVDLDNDGDQDLAIAAMTALLVFENAGAAGNPRFKLRAELLKGSPDPDIKSLSAADVDGDGFLDLYVCIYYGPDERDRFAPQPAPQPTHDANNGGRNVLLRNRSEFGFEDATAETGLDSDNRRFTLAAGWEDYDNDGDQDLYVANDFGRNCLYRNDDGHFENVAGELGVEDQSFGMSVSWGDPNGDGRMDLYVSNMFSAAGNRVTYQRQFKQGLGSDELEQMRYLARGNSLFTQQSDGSFRDDSLTSGTTMGRWAWASCFADLNNDGWEDVLVANGYQTNDSKSDL